MCSALTRMNRFPIVHRTMHNSTDIIVLTIHSIPFIWGIYSEYVSTIHIEQTSSIGIDVISASLVGQIS